MNKTLVPGAWKVATVIGIPIRVHFSWFIVSWSFIYSLFPEGRIIVMENDKVVGLITRNGIARYLQIMGK